MTKGLIEVVALGIALIATGALIVAVAVGLVAFVIVVL